MKLLQDNKHHRALQHFRSAVERRPHLAVDIAEHCVSAKRPEVALQVLDRYERVPEREVDVDFSHYVCSAYATAHHALAHGRFGRFRPKHNAAEIKYLQNATYLSTWKKLDGISRWSLALAERYCHLKFGTCFTNVRRDNVAHAKGRDDAELFVGVIDIALFRLEHGDVESLDILETLVSKGPSDDARGTVVAHQRERLVDTLNKLLELDGTANKARVQNFLSALTN